MNIDSLTNFFPPLKKKRENWEKIQELLVQIECQQNMLAEDAEMFRAIFSVSPIPMLVVCVEDATVRQVNDAFVRFTGYGMNEVVGKTIYELSLYETPSDRALVVANILDKGFVLQTPVSFRMKDGVIRKCYLSSKIYSRKGKKMMISVVDIAENMHRRIGDHGGVGVL